MGIAVIDPDRLRQLRDDIQASDTGLPESLCRDVADLLRVADVTLALIGGSDRRFTLCASSPNASTLDHWQFTLDQGPCLDAATGGRTVSASIASPEGAPWPLLAEKATELGYLAIGGVPLAVSGRIFGAINLQAVVATLDEDTVEDAEEVARQLSGPIVERLAETAPALVNLSHHATVHQAVGMISAQMRIGIEDAMAVLRAHAWTEGRLLVRIAEEVVDRHLTFQTPEDG